MPTIDLTNYNSSTLGLVQSTQGRSGTPDGNIFFDVTNGRIEIITVEELATIDMTSRGGSASATNPLTQQDGVKMEALYAFEREQRRLDEVLRQYDYFFKGTFKFGGAYELVNGRKFDDADGSATSLTGDDRFKVRGSGWLERNAAGSIGRIYYGVRSLSNIETASAPYYQLSDGGVPVIFDKVGPVDEAIQVYGDSAVDANTTTFDSRTFLSMKVRSYGFNYDEKQLADSGVVQMDGYASGFALGESVHLTTNTTDHPVASVLDGGDPPVPANQTGVWTGMTLEEVDAAETKTGFTTADAPFTWVLRNPGNANLDECIAFLDAIAQTDADINSHATNVTRGKRVGTWYTYNAAGKILPRTNIPSAGLFIENLSGTDKTRVIFTDDNDATKEYPNYLNVSVSVGSNAVADTNAWIHAFFLTGLNAQVGDNFNTATAITVADSSDTPVKGDLSTMTQVASNPTYRTTDSVKFTYDWNANTDNGNAAQNKDVVFECEGDGGVTAAKTIFTLTDPAVAASISASCVPPVETNV